MTEKREKSPKNDSSLEKKEVIKSETKNDTSFKFGKWKATCFIVLVSLAVRNLFHEKTAKYRQKADGFLELVPEKYDESDLFEWTPAPVPVSRPKERGDMGSAVEVPDNLKEEAKSRFKEHQFDLIANELMSLNRTLPDVRYPECLHVTYPKKLPQASIIIVYHNEAWSALIRTIWSVITQSPRELLKEVILVDDFSTFTHLEKPLQEYVKKFPIPVILSKTMSRVGLIQARLLGAQKASGKVMVFLDAHCECVRGWLEALLTPLVHSRTTVATPIIDVIHHTTMELNTADINSRGAFDLTLTFTWEPIPKRVLDKLKNDRTAYIESPAMAGGLFAIDREYFYNLGSYDEKMTIWGGENLEMSVRVWTCGGKLVMVPCSRVGHIFRDNSPYELPGGADHVIAHNLARMADVWLDEYKDMFYTTNVRAYERRTNVTERQLLRKNLQCKPFKWYLENIYPENAFNAKNPRMVQIYSLLQDDMCLDSLSESRIHNRNLEIKPCHNERGNQLFLLTDDEQIREKKYCLDATQPGEPIKLYDCHFLGGNQRWVYDEDTNMIHHGDGTNCLTLVEGSDVLTIDECIGSLAQQWFAEPLGLPDLTDEE